MDIRESALNIVKTLQTNGHQAVFCGGAVRDMLLGKIPHDYDIATSATPDQVESLFKHTKAVGKSFGVILVRKHNVDFEVSTFRNDGNYSDGRRPDSVSFSTMEEDAKRRDFTCNALFFDPITKKIHDFVGGLKDIQTKTLRFVGNPEERIAEDKLRILRFVRFLVKLKFNMNNLSYTSVRAHAMEAVTIAPERIKEELVKMLSHDRPKQVIELLFQTHLIYFILPSIARLENEEQDPIWHPEINCLTHTLLALDHVKDESYIVKLAVLFHDIGKPDTHEIINGRITTREHHKVGADIVVNVLKDLKFSNDEIEQVRWLVYNHMKEATKLRKSKLKKLLAHPQINDLIKVMKADKLGSHGNIEETDFLEEKLKEWTPEEIKPNSLISGKDLIKLGLKPSPIFKIILDKIVDLQLEGELKTKEETIEFVKRKFIK